MESMDIDMVIDIPDTPDRISAKRRQAAGKEHVSSSSSCSRNFCLFDEDHSNKMGDSERITRNRSLLGRTNSAGELENRNGVQPSGKAPLFRRTAGEKDKGKAICTKFPLKLSGAQRPLKVAGKDDKGKGKLNDETEKERIILSSPSPPKNDDCILSFDRPILRAPQRRRLVKNGCISPHGIAARAKRPAEDIQSSSKDDLPEQHCTRKATFSNPSPVDIQEIVKEDDASDEAKGKRAITRRHFSKDSEIQIIDGDETRDRRGETSGSGGQSSTDSRQTRIDRPCPSRNKLRLMLSAPTTSSLSAETNPESEHSQINNRAIKRRRSNEFNSAASDEPGTSLYGTSGESHRSRLSNFQNRQNGAMLHQVLGTDTSPGGIDGTGSVDNHESEARARQLEADEWLARELQEQLDQDASIFDHEIDERIAWALQQQENSRRASSSRNNHPRPRSSSVSSLRQARAQLQQNSLNRRANMPRANSSVRTARSRGNPSGRSIARIPRNLNFRFPTGMAIESRVDMLEVLEAAAEELNGSMNRTSRLLQFDGEFNEQHYEMLLALDEDNHQRGGASVNLVNSLPQSTVKTDSFEEACAICLDTPAKGDVIRHLPCLHKFHKDCIDPWLGRSKSCPVCKSLIS